MADTTNTENRFAALRCPEGYEVRDFETMRCKAIFSRKADAEREVRRLAALAEREA